MSHRTRASSSCAPSRSPSEDEETREYENALTDGENVSDSESTSHHGFAAAGGNDRDALAAWESHIREHAIVIRSLARQNAKAAAERMIEASLRSYKKLRPEKFEVGDRVRVSFLALSSVRAITKSRMLGEMVPMFSPKVYEVISVYDNGDFATYDVESSEDGDNDLMIGTRHFTLPDSLPRVDRRLRLHQPTRVRHGTLWRRFPGTVDAAFVN